MKDFSASLQKAMAEHITDLQAAMAKQMQQLMDNLQGTMTNLAGSGDES